MCIRDRNGTVLIFDEVITGFRLSYGGAGEYYGVKPDLVTLGKIVGGGMPMAAYGGKREIMETIAPVGPVYQAVSYTHLDVYKRQVIDTERKIENKQGPVLYLRPKSLYLGVGCKKQIDAEWLLACFEDFMQKEGICRENIQAVATISLKAEEKGIKKLLSALGAELIVVDMEDIRKLEEEGIIGSKEALIEKSDFVKKVTGAG